jgi:hypothetical protein
MLGYGHVIMVSTFRKDSGIRKLLGIKRKRELRTALVRGADDAVTAAELLCSHESHKKLGNTSVMQLSIPYPVYDQIRYHPSIGVD